MLLPSCTIGNGLIASLAANILLPLALLIPPTTLSHTTLASTFLPLIWGCHIFSWNCNLGFIVAVHGLWSTELLFFRHPREQFKALRLQKPSSLSTEKHSKNEDPVWKEAYPESILKRFWWVTKLVMSMRFIGWDIGDNKSPMILPFYESWKSRGYWLLRKSISMGLCFALLDVTNFYQHFDPYFQISGSIDEQLPQRLRTFFIRNHLGFVSPRAIRICILGLQQYATFSIIVPVLSLIPVLIGGFGLVDDFWGGTYNWQPMMGNPLVVLQSGLRGFWGAFWQQLFRPIFLSPGKVLADILGFHARSSARYTVQIMTGFFVSGALHASTMPLNLEELKPIRYASFFWIQGGLVVAESLACRAIPPQYSRRVKPFWMEACLSLTRLAWVVGSLYYTVPIIEDELIKVSRVMGLRPVLLFTPPDR